MKKLLFSLLSLVSLWLTSCSINKQIAKQANQTIFSDNNFAPAHVGISIYDPSTDTYLYNYQGDKYFVPASNTKLFTCYAAMKNLGDSLVGLRYQNNTDTAINVFATGDPTFMHDDFKNQPVLDFLKKEKRKLYLSTTSIKNQVTPLGRGWAWDDYESDYMAERSSFPIHGNIIKIKLNNYKFDGRASINLNWSVAPNYFKSLLDTSLSLPLVKAASMQMRDSANAKKFLSSFEIRRERVENKLSVAFTDSKFKQAEMPFVTKDKETTIEILKNDYQINGIKVGWIFINAVNPDIRKAPAYLTIHSQPTDSLLKLTMHRSDNFFAEQTLLMVSNERIGVMNDRAIIDTLLNTDFKGIPQKPKWVDGSGLSRYNLITPQDFVWVLTQMKNNFTWERISTILPTGNEGTLVGYYKNYVGKIYAKTGTLSNNVALSGFITTNKGKQLIFSILVNNHQTSASNIRRTIEQFLTGIMEKY